MDNSQIERMLTSLHEISDEMLQLREALEDFNQAYRQEHGQARYE